MSGNNEFYTSCFTCHEDPIPIIGFIDRTLPNKRTYNVLIGCSKGHLTPFVIKPSSQRKILIQEDKVILGGIKRLEQSYNTIVQYFKSDKKFRDEYTDIIRAIISGDQKGAIIHIRYFMEIYQRYTFFDFAVSQNEDTETKWSELKGSKLYMILINKNWVDKRLDKTLVEKNRQFLESNNSNISQLKIEYKEVSEQLHYFSRDNKKYNEIPKKEWAIQEVTEKLMEFLKICTSILNTSTMVGSVKDIESGMKDVKNNE